MATTQYLINAQLARFLADTMEVVKLDRAGIESLYQAMKKYNRFAWQHGLRFDHIVDEKEVLARCPVIGAVVPCVLCAFNQEV